MILLEQFEHDPPAGKPKLKLTPPTSNMEFYMTPPYFFAAPPPRHLNNERSLKRIIKTPFTSTALRGHIVGQNLALKTRGRGIQMTGA